MFARLAATAVLGLATLGGAFAQEPIFFRIATGGVAGTYYPVGGLLANIISAPSGGRSCEDGGSCGVPGLIAVVQSSQGSVENIAGIAEGLFESGFVQADIAFWAYSGTGLFEGEPPRENLRAIANLFPESLHLVARKDAKIASVRDLAGKRVSLDMAGSGTLPEARLVLAAFGVAEDSLEIASIPPTEAVDRMLAGEIDAFFYVAGYPTPSIAELARSGDIVLVPIGGPEADALLDAQPFFSRRVVPAGTYEGIPATPTVSVSAQWLVGAEVDEVLVHGITSALWNASSRRLLDDGHIRATDIRIENALDDLAVPLHPGAARYYEEAGLLTRAAAAELMRRPAADEASAGAPPPPLPAPPR